MKGIKKFLALTLMGSVLVAAGDCTLQKQLCKVFTYLGQPCPDVPIVEVVD